MPDPITACDRLREADQAYHDLVMGHTVRSITDENGETISFTQGNRDSLLSYIQRLSVLCPSYVPTAMASAQAAGPMRFLF